MKKSIYIIFFVLMSALTACERAIPYNGEYEDPKLVVQTELEDGSSMVNCIVLRSSFFLDAPRNERLWYPSEGVVLTVERENGEVASMTDSAFTEKNRVFHVPLATPLLVGETVKVQVSHPDYPTAYGSDIIVPMPRVEVVSCVWDSTADCSRIRLRFTDDGSFKGAMGISAKLNYWLVHKSATSTTSSSHHSMYIYSKDVAFAGMGNATSSNEGFNSFSELFFKRADVRNNEIEFTAQATVRSSASQFIRPADVDISVIAHSSDSYYIWRSLYNYFGAYGNSEADLGSMISDMFGMEETVQIYTNVKNGYGAVIATSTYTETIDLKQ